MFIFLFHVVFNEKVRATVVRWLRRNCCCCCVEDYSSSGSNSASYPSSRQRIKNMINGHSSDDSHPSTASTDPSQPRSPSSPPPPYWSSTTSSEKSSSMAGGAANPLPVTDATDDLHGKPTKYGEWLSKLDEVDHHCSKKCEESQPYPFPPDKQTNVTTIRRASTLETKRPVRRKKYPLGMPMDQRGSHVAKEQAPKDLHYTIINTSQQTGIVSYANPTVVEHF